MTAIQTILPLKSGKKNFITRLQSSQLHGWLQSLGTEVSQRSAGELARRATEHLGFLVTDGNVSNLRKQMGLAPGGRRGIRNAKAKLELSIEEQALTIKLVKTTLKQVDESRNVLDAAIHNLSSLLLLLERLK